MKEVKTVIVTCPKCGCVLKISTDAKQFYCTKCFVRTVVK